MGRAAVADIVRTVGAGCADIDAWEDPSVIDFNERR